MTFKLDVRGDVNRMLRQNAGMHEKILRAAARAVNATAADVRKAAIDDIAARNKSFSKQTVRGYVTVKQAKVSKQSIRQDGTVRVNYGGITARVIAAGKAPNLIYFVTPAARNPAAWRQGDGVAANVAGRTTVYNGTFVVRARNGKMIVVTRSQAAKSSPRSMRYKDGEGKWKWRPKWSKGIYGPPLKALAGNQQTFEVMQTTARTVWPGYWRRETERVMREAGA
jgi:hypothetical protein